MAQVDKLIPTIIKWEAGTTGEGLTNKELFEKARIKGFANDPVDSGGATMVGVTLATFKEYRKRKKKPTPTVKDLKAITYEEWRDILKTMFWDKVACRFPFRGWLPVYGQTEGLSGQSGG